MVGLDWIDMSSPKLQVWDFWKKWKNIKGSVNWAPLSQGYHKLCEPPNLTKFGKFDGGPGELWAHGDGVVELHVRVTITTPHLFFFPFISSFSSSSSFPSSSSFFLTNATHKNLT